MHLFNTLTRRVEPLAAPTAGQPFTFYSCGPTVYDFAGLFVGGVCLGASPSAAK